jgi:hypothetical protein
LFVHNIELRPGSGGQVCRTAGASAQLMAREGDYALFRFRGDIGDGENVSFLSREINVEISGIPVTVGEANAGAFVERYGMTSYVAIYAVGATTEIEPDYYS